MLPQSRRAQASVSGAYPGSPTSYLGVPNAPSQPSPVTPPQPAPNFGWERYFDKLSNESGGMRKTPKDKKGGMVFQDGPLKGMTIGEAEEFARTQWGQLSPQDQHSMFEQANMIGMRTPAGMQANQAHNQSMYGVPQQFGPFQGGLHQPPATAVPMSGTPGESYRSIGGVSVANASNDSGLGYLRTPQEVAARNAEVRGKDIGAVGSRVPYTPDGISSDANRTLVEGEDGERVLVSRYGYGHSSIADAGPNAPKMFVGQPQPQSNSTPTQQPVLSKPPSSGGVTAPSADPVVPTAPVAQVWESQPPVAGSSGQPIPSSQPPGSERLDSASTIGVGSSFKAPDKPSMAYRAGASIREGWEKMGEHNRNWNRKMEQLPGKVADGAQKVGVSIAESSRAADAVAKKAAQQVMDSGVGVIKDFQAGYSKPNQKVPKPKSP